MIGQQLFIKGLALSYFFAFASLLFQFRALYGDEGIFPLSNWMDQLKRVYGRAAFTQVPSLFWWRQDEVFQKVILLGGMGVSLLTLLGVCPPLGFLLCWILYGSYGSLGTVFLGYQWDALIQEVGFIAIFYSLQTPPQIYWQFAMCLLLFRFMFSSGVVKLRSGCPEWRTCRAMDLHYESQPLPNRLAWWWHQQARCLSTFSCLVVLFVEIGVPFLLFFPSPYRELAAACLIGLQGLILLSGNYAFFNLLTIAMCFPLISDAYWPSCFSFGFHDAAPWSWQGEMALTALALFFILLNTLQLASLFVRLGPSSRWLNWASRWHISSSYGLFARMTVDRMEIVVEGSRDGETWQPYEFHWKPGCVDAPPRQVAPHQPRIDWQMWFAALGTYKQNDWYLRFLRCLLEGNRPVLAQLKVNPFEGAPPRYIRSELYQYHFTDWSTGWETGRWWDRDYVGAYAPTVSLESDST